MSDRQATIAVLTEQRNELFQQRAAWQGLVIDPAFNKLLDHLRARIRNQRNNDYSTLIKNLDEAFATCGLRAEVAGLQYAVSAVSSEIAAINEQIELITQELESYERPNDTNAARA